MFSALCYKNRFITFQCVEYLKNLTKGEDIEKTNAQNALQRKDQVSPFSIIIFMKPKGVSKAKRCWWNLIWQRYAKRKRKFLKKKLSDQLS